MTLGGMDSSNQLLGSRYRILRELGRGGFGYTYLAEDINRFNELCVLKEFFPQVNDEAGLQKAKQLFEREADVLYQLNHPQIPRFRELLRVQTNYQGRIFLVQDYVEGPTYQELLETRLTSGSCFSESEVIRMLQQILPVFDYLHGVGVVHRDVAPDNLIQRNSDGLPVLIDFGGVKQLATAVQQQVGATTVPTRLGKVGYAPEEQLEAGQVSPSADLYALAVTALVLLTGQSPDVLYDRYTKQWHWQQYVSLSPRLTKLLNRMLAPRVGDRYSSASAISKALSNPDTYATPTYIPNNTNHNYVEPTVAVAPGRGVTPPSTIAAPPGSAPKPSKKRSANTNGCWQALLGLFLLIGSISLVWWLASRWDPTGSTTLSNSGDVETSAGEETNEPSNPSFSTEEQARKNDLKQRRDALQINNQFLVKLTDQLFFAQFPQMQGQALSDRPEDADLRAEWDSISNEVLTVLENNLSTEARKRLGSFSAADRDRWRQQVNQHFVGSRALYDLTDAKFAYLYPQNAAQDFIDQPIGQIWHGLAYDRVQAIESGERREEIQFGSGEFGQSLRDRLDAGEGRIYTINLSEGQFMRLNLQAPPQSTRLSVYVPNPTDEIPVLLEDSSDRTWSGQLPQSGYYEIVVVSTQNAPLDYALDVSADNVTSTPSGPEASPEDKD
ncbi:serine/threonine-protein kinase [Oscillatoria sp. CS-180]|uniref:serine/threonine-protein kinase n=1 Tax=Oscillatoria sp. CS-180 TaxID=3021720 RepID=UPI00232E50B0|nr:serine/threonine-protein kinase [Oscillatoria sp. CS-180]MDB9525547.1 serine/threonine-protein kinase [Oscillatoria sp. CS-180]